MNQLQFMSRTAPKQAREEPVLDREIHTTATYPTRGPKGSLSLQADSLAARAAGSQGWLVLRRGRHRCWLNHA